MPDYKVTVEGSDPLPIRAGNRDSARNRAVRERVKVEPLTTEDALAFGAKGVALIVVGAEEEDKPVLIRANPETGLIERREDADSPWVESGPALIEQLIEAGPVSTWRVDPKGGMLQRHVGGGADDDDSNWADIREATKDEVAAAKPPKK